MPGELNDIVRYTGVPAFQGRVLSIFVASSGEVYSVVETAERYIFVNRRGMFEVVATMEQACLHNRGFSYHQGHTNGFWKCRMGCGYSLNFDPETLLRYT